MSDFATIWRQTWQRVGFAILISRRAHVIASRGAGKLMAHTLIHGREPHWDIDPETFEVRILGPNPEGRPAFERAPEPYRMFPWNLLRRGS